MHICPSCKEGCLDPHRRCPTCSLPLGPHTLKVGTELQGMMLEGKYKLDAFLKEGGMGWVYRGKHQVLGHSVAVKLMKPGKNSEKNRIKRFKREAKAVSLLHHPHIVSITDFGQTAGGQLFIVSEYVRGVTLTDILNETGPLPFSRVLRVFAQIMAAVEEAHGNQVIHRDLKPENIMVSTLRGGEDFIKLLDFGIAKMTASPSLNVTVAGEVCGTPSYMAPEQIRGKPPTVQTDVYALGVLMFELLTGHAPFRGSTVEETLSMHLYEPRPSLLSEAVHDDVPPALEDIFQSALAVSPRERFQSVAEMRSSLFSMTSELPLVDSLPCTACNRPPDSPIGFCSEHCEPKLEAALVDFRQHQGEGAYADFEMDEGSAGESLEIDDPAPGSDDFQSLRRSPTSDIPGVVDTGVRLISLADTLSSWDQLQRLDLTEPAHLVGRRQVLSALEIFLEDSTGVLEITGTPGTGRTTVLQAAGRIADARSWKVLRSGADPSFSLSPLYTVRQLLIQVLQMGTRPPTLKELRDRVTSSGLSSEDTHALVGLFRPNRALQVEDTLVHYEELMASAIRAVESFILDNGPLCVLLDDATDYDGGSLDFTRRLCAAADGTTLKVILALESPLLNEDGTQQSLNLAPLNAEEVAVLAQAAAGNARPLGAAYLDRLADRTRGNPFHVRQAIREVPSTEDEEEADDLTLEDLIIRRAGTLSQEARDLLQAICIFGNAAPARLIVQLDIDKESLPRAMDELMEHGFIREGGSEDLLAIKHDFLAKVIHSRIPPERRAKLHVLALSALEEDGELLTVRARHAFEGMLGRRALNLLERAGDLSMRCRDHMGAALHHYPRALHVSRFQMGYPPENPRNLRLAIKLARSLRLSGHLLSADMTLEEASQAANENPAAMALVQLETGRLATMREQPDKAKAAFNDAIRLSLTVGKPDVLMDAYLDLAETYTRRGDAPAALAELEEGLLMVSGGGGTNDSKAPKKFWRLLLGLAEQLIVDGQMDRAVRTTRDALIHAEHEQSPRGRALAHRHLGLLGHTNGDQHTAEQNLSTAITLFKRLGDRKAMAECLLLQAQHRPGAEDTLVGQALQLSRQISWSDGIDQALRLVAQD